MKSLALLFLLFFSNSLWAQSLEVSLDPREPIVDESFNLIIKVQNAGGGDPSISFNPGSAEVLGRRNAGTSISTTIVNGKMKTSREGTYIYELITSRSGRKRIANIAVEINGQTLRHGDIVYNVLQKRKEPKKVFLRAEPSKNIVYKGEGLDIDYYLYYRVQVTGLEVRRFPKLNNFIKRFQKVDESPQSVSIDGVLYKKSLRYSARIFPEKTGKIRIDSLKLKASIPSGRGSNRNKFGGFGSFGSFGFGFQRMRDVNFSSKPVTIEVLPIPTENVPANFTGLVGDHIVNLRVPQTKFLVNEAVEARLEIIGEGLIEGWDAPAIYNSDALEDFENRSEVVELGGGRAKKVYDLTYLGRTSVNIKERELKLSFFDPSSKSFIEKSIIVPPLLISGQAQKSKKGLTDFKKESEKSENGDSNVENSVRLIAPEFRSERGFSVQAIIKNMRWILVLGIFLMILLEFYQLWVTKKRKNLVKGSIESLKSQGINYKRLYDLFWIVAGHREDVKRKPALEDLIESLALSQNAKSYFKVLADKTSMEGYGPYSKKQSLEFEKAHFEELESLKN